MHTHKCTHNGGHVKKVKYKEYSHMINLQYTTIILWSGLKITAV